MGKRSEHNKALVGVHLKLNGKLPGTYPIYKDDFVVHPTWWLKRHERNLPGPVLNRAIRFTQITGSFKKF